MWSIHCDKGREAPIEFLQKMSQNLIIEQMTVGDYAISLDLNIKVIIERKTWKDLAATIKDPERKANHQKLLDLREKIGCDILYIIEGPAFPSPERKFDGIPHKCLLAHLHHLMFRDKCSYVQTSDVEHTAKTLVSLMNSMKTLGVVGGAPNSALLKERHPRSPEVVKQKIMMKIHGVSNTNFPIIKQHFNITDLVNKNLTSELSELQHSSGRKFGTKNATKINKSAKDVQTHIKMLAEINGVTNNTATEILKIYPMSSIIDGSISVDALSSIKKTSTSNVGNALATRILSTMRDNV